MGTIAEIGVVHRGHRYAHRAIDAAIDELRWVDRTMTRFSERSDIGRANRDAAQHPVRVSPETAFVLRDALRWAEDSSGAFDPCLGKTLMLWDVGHRRSPPPDKQVSRLAGRALFRLLELESGSGGASVRFHDPDVAIDLGGIAKGFGVDRAVAKLRDYGISDALVNVGGDLYALGRSENGDPWKVGIRHPARPMTLIEVMDASDCAIATSGDYLQYFEHGGRRYHHLFDPVTGSPRRSRMRSLTVMAPTCMSADAAGTAGFGQRLERVDELIAACAPQARVIHTA